MKKICINVLLIAMASPIAFSQTTANFNSAEEVHQQEITAKRDEKSKSQQKLVGKVFWYKPGEIKNPFHEFYLSATVSSRGIVEYKKQIFPNNIIKFEVVDSLQLGKTYTGYIEYTYKIRFEDGTEAFMRGDSLWFTVGTDIRSFFSYSVSTSVRDAKSDYETHIFIENPAAIIARHEQREREASERMEREKADQIVAEAKADANRLKVEALNAKKGGVRLGMSKKQVLASSWGKPDQINRTIFKGGTREQWVYGSASYLYFDNNILATIQN